MQRRWSCSSCLAARRCRRCRLTTEWGLNRFRIILNRCLEQIITNTVHCSLTFLTGSWCCSRAFLLQWSILTEWPWAVALRTKPFRLFRLFRLFGSLRWCGSQDITLIPCTLLNLCILLLRLCNMTRLFILLSFHLKTIKANVWAQSTERRSYTGAFHWRWMRLIVYSSMNTPAWALLRHWLERLWKRALNIQLCKLNRSSSSHSLCH